MLHSKELLRHQRANVTFQSALVASCSSQSLQKLLANSDGQISIKKESGKHAIANRSNDINRIISIACSNKKLFIFQFLIV